MKKPPAVSVIMPAYNSGKFIHEAIDSILNQSFRDFELIILNDGSSDSTEEVINSYKDSRIKYISKETNIGLVGVLNEGLDIAAGKYIARMDADDISYPERLEIQVKFLEENPEIGICGTWYENFGGLSDIVERPVTFDEIRFHLFYGSPIPHPSAMMRKEMMEKYNLKYDEKFIYVEDYDLFERASHCFPMANIPSVLLKYRKHPEQITSQKWKLQDNLKNSIQRRRFLMCCNDEVNSSHLKWLSNFFDADFNQTKTLFRYYSYYKDFLISENFRSNYYDKEMFGRVLEDIFISKRKTSLKNYFLKKYKNNTGYNPYLIYLLLREPLSFLKFLELKEISKFLIKCFLFYKSPSSRLGSSGEH